VEEVERVDRFFKNQMVECGRCRPGQPSVLVVTTMIRLRRRGGVLMHRAGSHVLCGVVLLASLHGGAV